MKFSIIFLAKRQKQKKLLNKNVNLIDYPKKYSKALWSFRMTFTKIIASLLGDDVFCILPQVLEIRRQSEATLHVQTCLQIAVRTEFTVSCEWGL